MIRRLLATIAILTALAAPAQAGVAIIAGSGTGGQLANGTSTGTTTVVGTTTASVSAGSLIVVGVGIRNINFTSACTDTAGNTYTLAVNKGVGGGDAVIYYSYTTSVLSSGATITCTNSNTSGKGLIAVAFSGSDPTPLDAATPVGTTGSGTAISVGPTGTLSCPTPSGGGNCEALVGFYQTSATAATTEDAAFTDLGTLTANSSNVHMGYKLVTANTAITYAPTNTNSGTWVAVLGAFKSATGALTVHNLSSAGAGK